MRLVHRDCCAPPPIKSIVFHLHPFREVAMYRGILIALLSGVILLAFAALPPMLPGSKTASLSGSAQAEKAPLPKTDATNLNSSRSNVNRMGGGGGATPPKQQTGTPK